MSASHATTAERPRPLALAGAADIAAHGGGLLAALPLWAWLVLADGGYPAVRWLPAVGYLAAAGVVCARYLPRPALSRAQAVSLAGLAALAALSAISLLWADDRGAAWTAAERAHLHALAFALPLAWPPSARALRAACGGLVLLCLAALALALIAAAGDPRSFVDGRLVAPTGYANATAALLVAAGLPAILLAARRHPGVTVRAAWLAAGGTVVASSLLAQSRGGLISLIVAVALVTALAPLRRRTLAPVALALTGAAVVAWPLLAVRREVLDGTGHAAVRGAGLTLVLLFVALLAIGVAYARWDERLAARSPRPGSGRAPRRVRRRALVLAIGALAALAAITSSGLPADVLEDLRTPRYERVADADTRFESGLGSNRVDYWRVAAEVGAGRPLTGTGAGGFGAAYLERRSTDRAPVYAHSEWMQAWSELGAPGLAALLAFAGALVVLLRRRLQGADGGGFTTLAAAAPCVYLLVHGSGDWLGPFPAVTVPALGLAGTAIASRGGAPSRRLRTPALVALVGWAVLAAAAAGPPFLGAALVDRAQSRSAADPAGALRDLASARRADPAGTAAPLVEGVVRLRAHDMPAARAAFAEAARRDPGDWFARFELGLIAGARGQRAEAIAQLERAGALNPRERLVTDALRDVPEGRAANPLAAARAILHEPD